MEFDLRGLKDGEKVKITYDSEGRPISIEKRGIDDGEGCCGVLVLLGAIAGLLSLGWYFWGH